MGINKKNNNEMDDAFYYERKYENYPYQREYTSLSNEELIELLEKCRINKWDALDLSNCGLSTLPECIGNLNHLISLNLSNVAKIRNTVNSGSDNSFSIPSVIGELYNLEYLSLYGTNITKLPKEFKNLTKLVVLNLNGCKFKEFPKEILELKNLKVLCIDSISSIPEEIYKLSNMVELYLPKAKIKTLPPGIGKLEKLKKLYLSRTLIEKIPYEMKFLQNLKYIEFEKTPIYNMIPIEIFEQTPLEIIDYIIRFQEENNKILLNESKMIIVGQGGVGKTCLLNRLVYDNYSSSLSTEGIDISQWEFDIDSNKVKLHIWDFGGQEIYHATHQFFLSKRSLYIFVWDARQEEEYGRIDYWLNTIQTFAGDSPIIIVVNKCDESRKNIKILDINDYKCKFPQITEIVYVSCQDNINIDNLRNIIQQNAIKLPLMKSYWFTEWFNIRKELQELAQIKNIITYNEYINICSKFKVGKSEALSLIKYLHDLGVLLYFYEDVLLKDIVILSPEWGTDAVYKILDSQATHLKNRNGILYYSDLSIIWNDLYRYPCETYKYILKLMEKFQLAFNVRGNDTYLIAELLENSKPSVNIEFNKKNTINFRFEYKFLPAGIITRFIVNSNIYLMNKDGKKLCWLKGAYLTYGNAIALVHMYDSITEKYIDIKVMGNNRRDRYELLNIIRHHFSEIHNNIPKINVVDKILCNCEENCKYFHDYNYLMRLEAQGIFTERCRDSLRDISILNLIDGIDLNNKTRKNKLYRREIMQNITVNPVINNINTNTNSNTNSNSISMEIKINIMELQGCLNDLKEEIIEKDPQFSNEYQKISNSINKIENAESKEDIIKSGALNKVKRFIDECNDETTAIGKIVKGIKYGSSIVKNIAKKYNSIAEWCGAPVIPRIFVD